MKNEMTSIESIGGQHLKKMKKKLIKRTHNTHFHTKNKQTVNRLLCLIVATACTVFLWDVQQMYLLMLPT